MSILLESDCGWIISHLKFFERIKVASPPLLPACSGQASVNSKDDNNYCFLTLNPDLFEITEPFKDVKEKTAKSPHTKPPLLSEEAKLVKTLYDAILNDPIAKEIFGIIEITAQNTTSNVKIEYTKQDLNVIHTAMSLVKESEHARKSSNMNGGISGWPKSNLKAVHACQTFFDTVKTLELSHFHGQNPVSDITAISTVAGNSVHRYLFPPNTKFYCNDVTNIEKVFQENNEITFYDLIVMDPPWWNKFIRRRKRKQHEAGYEMLNDDVIAKLPISKILNADGILVVWCTNAKSHKEKLINEFFPSWGVRHEKTLYWLKVTKFGTPICPFNAETKKQPYETIIIGRKESLSPLSVPFSHTISEKNKSKVIISVPSSINSHKPPVIDLIKRMYIGEKIDKKLEIFARYLVPGFVSYGNEVVKLQHETLYNTI